MTRRVPLRSIPSMPVAQAVLLALAFVVVVGGTACAAGAAPLDAVDPDAPPTAYFVAEDATPARWSLDASPRWHTLEGVLPPAAAREVAFDEASGLLWYSDDHGRVGSIDPESLEAGPSIGGFSDVALAGCSVTGRPRTLAVDAARRALLVPQLTGGVLEYRLDGMSLDGAISSDVFGEAALGSLRHIVVAPDGHLWFLSADGSLVEVDRRAGPTGRRAVLPERVVAIAGDGSAAPVVRTEDGALWLLEDGDAVRPR